MRNKIKPFLKWAGGKTQLLPTIIENLPKNINKYNTYVEPFLGAGAVFFYLIKHNYFERYIVNDLNKKLINLYLNIRDNIDNLIIELDRIKSDYFKFESLEEKEEFYYRVRNEFNSENINKIRESALFIFLNKTCFNGLYRENSKGEFNVPFGKHKTPTIYVEEQLKEISLLLNLKDTEGNNRVLILNKSFELLEEYVDENTFVYFDPPYRPITKGGFNSYDKSSFSDREQMKLAQFYEDISKKNASIMLSNSDPKNLDIDDEFFDILYKSFNIKRISAKRNINSDGTNRGEVTELLITNYNNVENDTIIINVKDEELNAMKDNFIYKKDSMTFNYLISTLQDSIKGWDYFVNWNKAIGNVKEIEIQLNILNYLIGKDNIKEEAKYLISKHPEIVQVIPILIACREKNFQIIDKDEINNSFEYKNYDFILTNNNTNDNIDKIVEFMEKTDILNLLSSKQIKNVVDYVLGVEVGLDSNGRKNRSGTAMETISESFIKKLCLSKGYAYMSQATPSKILKEWDYYVTVDKTSRRFDFAINTGNKLILIETNYYGGGGSKLKATAGEYKSLFDIIKKDRHEFIWITDGKGWLTASRPLEETFYHNNFIINIDMLSKNILEEII